MEKLTHVFQTDSEIIKDTYHSNPNYLTIYSEGEGIEEDYCIVYFSSHDIYYPNTEESFKDQLLKKDKYEWYNTRVKNGKKHIFLRDIQKQWYLKGINYQINSVDKLLKFLKEETKGYRVITLGSSAGGYAAVLFGSMLYAETIMSFNGRFFFKELLERSSEAKNPTVFRERDNPEVNQFFSLRPFIHSLNGTNMFYFFSSKSEMDNRQFNHVSDLKFDVIRFNTKHHGVPFLKSNLKHVINLTKDELKALTEKQNHPFFFSVRIDGLYITMKQIILQTYNFFIRKIKSSFVKNKT